MKRSYYKSISQDWNSFYQSVDIDLAFCTMFTLQAYVKAEVISSNGRAALWARVDNKDGSRGFFDNMVDRPITNENWDLYVINGELDQNSATLNFGGFCSFFGIFCFKNFELFIENKDGILESKKIKNPNLKGIKNQLNMPGWQQGTARELPLIVQEYTFQSIESNESEAPFLKISGTDILMSLDFKYPHQIDSLLRIMQNVGKRMIRAVQELNIKELDYNVPSIAVNSIGVLIMHICATEAYYQVYSFEGRPFDKRENLFWSPAMNLGEKLQNEYQKKPIEYYLSTYRNLRRRTLELFKDKQVVWCKEKLKNSDLNNYEAWLHVMEHQSYHLGQILLIKKAFDENKK